MTSLSNIHDDLNPAQQEAVDCTEGPLLLLAGAGSGKTKTLVHRIAHILSTNRADMNQILAVTFTNKAAKEMRQRVFELLHPDQSGEPNRSFMPFMGTFHSICVRILRLDGQYVGVSPNFVILDETDRRQLIKQILKDRQIDEKQFPLRALAGIISNNKNELVSPDEFSGFASGPIQEKAAEIYPEYEARLRTAQSLDFDDLIGLTVKLMQANSAIAKKWSQQFRYILIDEYQDTNNAQYRLIKMLVNEQQNLCVVGDDWQSIYAFRGADYRNILNFEKDYPSAKVIKLEQNYRSSGHILDAAHAVISKNSSRSDKKLWTAAGEGAKIRLFQASSERQEAEMIVSRIQAGINTGRKHQDYAVLYRTNAQSRAIEEQFMRYGVPYKIYGGLRFYDRAEIKDLVAYLRLIHQPEDITSFRRIINVPTRGLGAVSVKKFLDYAANQGSIESALNMVSNCPGLTSKSLQALVDFADIITKFREMSSSLTVSELLQKLTKRLDYISYVDDGTVTGAAKAENVAELSSVAESYSQIGLAGFLEEVSLLSGGEETNQGDDAVKLMTLHSAKGLEFPVVFIAGFEESVFPHSRAIYDNHELEEERRLCYVGMTRAKQELYLSYATSRILFGASQYNPVSRFVADIPKQHLETSGSLSSDKIMASAASVSQEAELAGWLNQTKSSDSSQEPRYETEINPGDRVKHQLFGEGLVLDADGDNLAIEFIGKGVKKLNKAFAKLEVL